MLVHFLLAAPQIIICKRKVQKLQSSAHPICRIARSDHLSPILCALHWLTVRSCVQYKILLTFKSLNNQAPLPISQVFSSCMFWLTNSSHLLLLDSFVFHLLSTNCASCTVHTEVTGCNGGLSDWSLQCDALSCTVHTEVIGCGGIGGLSDCSLQCDALSWTVHTEVTGCSGTGGHGDWLLWCDTLSCTVHTEVTGCSGTGGHGDWFLWCDTLSCTVHTEVTGCSGIGGHGDWSLWCDTLSCTVHTEVIGCSRIGGHCDWFLWCDTLYFLYSSCWGNWMQQDWWSQWLIVTMWHIVLR